MLLVHLSSVASHFNYSILNWDFEGDKKANKTRLVSIESQPKKIDVVVVVVIDVIIVVHIVVVVIPVVDTRNIHLKFG